MRKIVLLMLIPVFSFGQLKVSKLPVKNIYNSNDLYIYHDESPNEIAGQYLMKSYKNKRASVFVALLTSVLILSSNDDGFTKGAYYIGGFFTGFYFWRGEWFVYKAGDVLQYQENSSYYE